MKTTKQQQFWAIALVILMIAALFPIPSAHALAKEAKVYLVSFPRPGDEAYDQSWGHERLDLLGGWKLNADTHIMVRTVSAYDLTICYCIEPGVSQRIDDVLSSKDETFWDNYPDGYNDALEPDDIKLFIGRILQYGYTGKISTTWRSENEGGDTLAQALATQILIWETVVGERDVDFNKLDTGSKDAVLDMIGEKHPLRERILAHYQRMEKSVKTHTKIPSFCVRKSATSAAVSLEWDGQSYTKTLTDTNNVLERFTFTSSDPAMKISTRGNTLTLTAAKAPKGTVTISAKRAEGWRQGLVVWSDGSIDPSGTLQDVVCYSETLSDPIQAYLKVEVSFGGLKIKKTSEDNKIANISFTISGNGVNQTVKTGSDGTIQIDNLTPGEYTVTEKTGSQYEPAKSQKVTVASGQTAEVSFSNTLKRGSLKVTKTSEDGLVEGVKFRLSGTSLSGEKVDVTAATDKSGVVTFVNVLIGTGYTLQEVGTPERYVVPEMQNAAIEWNKVNEKSFANRLKKWRVTVTKTDRDSGHAQGDASLAGAVYGVYQDGKLIDEYTTDEKGKFTTNYYPCGEAWTIKEIAPSEGYLLDTAVYKVGCNAGDYTAEKNDIALSVKETVKKGNIALIKHSDDGETQLETPEVGAEFQVYLKSAGGYDKASDNERDLLTTNEDGYAASKALPYGIYTVHQTKGQDGRELLRDFDVYIAEDGKTYRYIANNAYFQSYLKVVKVDADTGRTIHCAGIGFKIYDPSGKAITQTFTYPEETTIDTFYTNDEGYLITPQKLPYGTGYTLVEVAAPYGYVLNSEPVAFNITQDNADADASITVVVVTVANHVQKGVIRVKKTGEVFTSVKNENGLYQSVYETQGLAGVVFEVTAAEDIQTPDGTLHHAAGDIVATLSTDGKGEAATEKLYLGKYAVREVAAPEGYVLNAEPAMVELAYAGQDVEVTATGTAITNERQKAAVSLNKTLEVSGPFEIGHNSEVTAVSFGLYAAENIAAADGTVIPKDGLIERIYVDAEGKASCQTDLPFGAYYLKELSTDPHYQLDDTCYPVTFEYAGQDTLWVEIEANEGKPIHNQLIRGQVRGRKVDIHGNALPSASIGLFAPGEENTICTVESAEDGSFFFENIPYGTWIVRELAAPEGYILSDTSYEVTISDHDEIVEIEIVNEQIHGSVHLTKVDADYPDHKLTGAEFEVYPDGSEEPLGTMTEITAGVYEMADLPYGSYWLRETKAPEGFVLDPNAYPFRITEPDEVVIVETEAGVGFINQPQRGSLKIIKTSSDGKLEGFIFRVIGDHFEKTFTTNAQGEILIEGLRIGEYTVSEVEDERSSVYILPADQTVTVEADSTCEVKMHNEYREIPKTGVNEDPRFWTVVMIVSGIGVVVFGILMHRENKK